ncbi:cellulase family glycosylhydrolase [Clostridium saccharobutylicum]|uniref:Beta-mannanase/endoglucanase A n=1 Tax=Clostridium saccharobutylicum TaxID=169679 RepID=A0A1S8MYA0_CLOSA|nr:cellulase family glycosylhydrolase [Clostridium saccharobutylicum]OOM09216.1 beta-mannanase/endoglucanase A precursor [Clostridium saccharobutylicum]
MKKIINFKILLSSLLLFFLGCVFQIPANAAEDSSWIRGANVPAIWYDSQSYSALDKVASDKFNTVRLVWDTSGSASRLDEFLTKCDNLKLKPIVELHDATGGAKTDTLNTCVNYWVRSDILSVMHNHPKAWLNVANEWGPANSTVWRDGYKEAVSRIRTAGYTGTIMIDAGGWGQDSNDILKYAKDIYNCNTNKNVIFSIHMYGSWNNDSDIDSFLSSCKSKGIPIIVGEFGYNYNNGSNNLGCKVDVAHLISYCKQNKIGFIAWSWSGNDSDNAWLDMTDNWGTYTWWGKYVTDNMW